ncbi:transcription factor MYB120 [Aplysia californica]|uniref:Transcription factor MYB120 n=1 Tax=Aplysia californica TaxID=6500 RepID=A0ABM0JKD4_APLCA|nr:transcription factor MYB120 [Aplysia californica]
MSSRPPSYEEAVLYPVEVRPDNSSQQQQQHHHHQHSGQRPEQQHRQQQPCQNPRDDHSHFSPLAPAVLNAIPPSIPHAGTASCPYTTPSSSSSPPDHSGQTFEHLEVTRRPPGLTSTLDTPSIVIHSAHSTPGEDFSTVDDMFPEQENNSQPQEPEPSGHNNTGIILDGHHTDDTARAFQCPNPHQTSVIGENGSLTSELQQTWATGGCSTTVPQLVENPQTSSDRLKDIPQQREDPIIPEPNATDASRVVSTNEVANANERVRAYKVNGNTPGLRYHNTANGANTTVVEVDNSILSDGRDRDETRIEMDEDISIPGANSSRKGNNSSCTQQQGAASVDTDVCDSLPSDKLLSESRTGVIIGAPSTGASGYDHQGYNNTQGPSARPKTNLGAGLGGGGGLIPSTHKMSRSYNDLSSRSKGGCRHDLIYMERVHGNSPACAVHSNSRETIPFHPNFHHLHHNHNYHQQQQQPHYKRSANNLGRSGRCEEDSDHYHNNPHQSQKQHLLPESRTFHGSRGMRSVSADDVRVRSGTDEYVWKDGKVQLKNGGISHGESVRYVWKDGHVEKITTDANNEDTQVEVLETSDGKACSKINPVFVCVFLIGVIAVVIILPVYYAS